jgi:tetratricopeptide (TPR) repeat protein
MDSQLLDRQVNEFRQMLKKGASEAYSRYGVTLLHSLDEETYFEEIARFGWEPSSATDLYNQGVLATEAGDHDKALELYEKAAELDDSLDFVQYNLAYTCGELGQKKEQKKALERYLELVSSKERRELPEEEQADLDAAKEALAEL